MWRDGYNSPLFVTKILPQTVEVLIILECPCILTPSSLASVCSCNMAECTECYSLAAL